MEDDNEYLKLPIEERCQHKLWKARVNGYKAATKLFKQIADEKSPEWSKYLGLVKKFVVDGNALAQEKGLEAVLAYVERAGCAGKTCGEVMSGIVSKCLGAPKAKTKETAQEIALMYVEVERAEIVQDELTKGLTGKAPKVVVACLQTLREALHQFGPKVITLKPLVKQLPIILEDRDKGVRDESKLLTVEIYRWIGAAIRPQIATLKPVQLSELEAEFEKVSTDKGVPMRYLRSQQDLKAKMAQQQAINNADDDEADEEDCKDSGAVDPYDLMQPVEIMSRLPKDFAERCCEAKKWQDRKEAVDSLLQLLAGNPRLEPDADYGDVVRALRRAVAKDSNVMVVAVAGRSLASLAAGLRKRFQQYVGQCFHVVLEKFKEKKQNVVAAMREAVDAMYLCSNLDALQEDLLASLESKNPSVKTETAAFIARAFSSCDTTSLGKKQLKAYCPALVKALNDNDKAVRDVAAEAIGTAMKVVGDKFIQSFLQDVDNLKMAKVKECCDKCELVRRSKRQNTKSANNPENGAESSRAKNGNGLKRSDNNVAGVGGTASRASASAPQRLPSSALSAKGVAKAGVKGGKAKKSSSATVNTPREAPEEKELTEDEVEEVATSILPPEVLPGLADATWNSRLAAMELFSETVRGLGNGDIPTQALVRILVAKPGLKESNFQVLKLKLEILTRLASSSSSFSRRSASYVLDDLAEKLGDAKNGAAAADALTAIADAIRSLDYVALRVLDLVMAQKSPKNQSEAINWLVSAIKAFGLVVQVKPIVEHVKKALNATNPAVRTSAISLLGVIFLYVGPSFRMLFENEKPAILQQIDAEFDKLQGVSAPLPTRGLKSKSDEAEAEMGKATDGGTFNVADLIPRSDISDQLQGSLIEELGDKDWKVRLEALQKLQSIVGDAKCIVPNLGDLPTALKARMADSNKNLAIQAMSICQAIGTGMGSNCSKFVRNLAPSMIAGLGDSKNTVRAAATSCLNSWVEQCGIEPFFDCELISDSLKLENPNLRTELYGWLGEHLPGARSVPISDLTLCVPCLFAALEDRNVDVRKKAQDAVLPFMIHLGYEQMTRASSKLKPMSRTLVVSLLDKTKQNLPTAPPICSAGGPKSVRGGGGRIAKATSPQGDGESEPPNPADDTKMASSKGRASTATVSSRVASKTKATSQTSKVSGVVKRGAVTEDADTSPPIVANNLKEQRIQDEQRLKVLKWNFTTPRDEFYELLKEQMTTAGFSRTLITQLFHNDFKFHIKALETFQECLENCPEASVANVDLILKWLALRFFDTNPSVILKSLEYLQALFALLAANVYHLHEIEGVSFVPYLVTKTGDPKDAVRNSVRQIFKLIYKVYSANKVFIHLMEGLKSKNARQRTECLDELGCLIEMYGMSVCQPNPSVALKEVAKQISDRDNGVRNAALNCIVQAFFLDGERIYKHIGAISDKDMDLLEERIKRASKNRVAPSQPTLKSGQQQQYGQSSAPVIGKSPSPETIKAKSMSPRPVTSQAIGEEQPGVVRRMMPVRGSQLARPISGAFSLDLDRLNQESSLEREDVVLPELFKPDLDDFSEPVRLPETKMRPPSPATKILNNSQDAACAMDLVISQVASNDAVASVQALAQIDEFLRDEDRAESMSTRVDQLIVAASLQFRLAHSRGVSGASSSASSSSLSSQADLVRLYRCLTMTVMTLFQNAALARRASRDVLRDLVHVLVSVLLDARLVDLNGGGLGGGSDGANVVRAINVLVIKMVERSDHTNMMSALIRLLHDCVANDNASAKFTELIMKCVWKIVRLLPTIMNDINLDRVLLDLHLFLVSFPSSQWRGRSNDMPLRTIKTVLHTLAKQKGNKIMSHLTLIDNLQDSEMESYLQKVLKGGVRHRSSGTSGGGTTNNNNNNIIDESSENNSPLTRRDSRHSPRRLSKTTHETLAEIFKKIGSKETTREGLADLYAFKKRHPEADIEPFLSKSSQFFQNYIERGLLNIEQERDGSSTRFSGQLHKQSGLSNSTGSIHSASMLDEHPATTCVTAGLDCGGTETYGAGAAASSVVEGTPSVYLERLKLIRAQCGLDNSKYDRLGVGVVSVSAASRAAFSKASSVTGSFEYTQSRIKDDVTLIRQRQDETIVSHVAHSCSSEGLSTIAGGGPVDDLKRRLERVKMGTKL